MNASWRLARLLDAPHRLAFGAGALVLALASLWWAGANLAAASGHAWRWSLPPAAAHGALMTFGFMPLFFAGFLFTAGPRWLGQAAPTPRALLRPVAAQLAGWGVFLLAAHGRDAAFGRTLGAFGLGAVAIGWAGVTWRLQRMLWASSVDESVHLRVVAAGCWAGVLALLAAGTGVALASPALVLAAVHAGLWGFVGLVFAALAHRMVPFFSAVDLPRLERRHPFWLLRILVAVFAFEALMQALDAIAGPPERGWQAVRALVDLVASLGLVALAWRWRRVQRLRVRIVRMLHAGVAWLGLALALSGASHAALAWDDASLVSSLAPLHAFTMGYLGSTLLAMVTRVSAGQGGRTVAIDDFVWRLFWLLQSAAVVRVAAALLAPWWPGATTALVALAAVAWAIVFGAWSLRYGRWYGTPRVDGRAG